MLDTFLTILIGLALLSVLILVHELGHFWAARICGVKVEEFGLGLPPRALQLFRDKKQTAFTLNWLPFGGFVRMKGEGEGGALSHLLKVKDTFIARPVGQRIFIVVAGVLMNFLTGVLFIFLGYLLGTQALLGNTAADRERFIAQNPRAEIQEEVQLGLPLIALEEKGIAARAGLKKFDFIAAVDGQEFATQAEFQALLAEKAGEKVRLTIWRRTKSFEKELIVGPAAEIGLLAGVYLAGTVADSAAAQAGIKPADLLLTVNGEPVGNLISLQTKLAERKGEVVELTLLRKGQTLIKKLPVDAEGRLGVMVDLSREQKIVKRIIFRLPFTAALKATYLRSLEWTQMIGRGIGRFFGSLLQGADLPEEMGGPVKIAQETFYNANSFAALLTLAALLSFSLAFFNLLPFPALDGGQLVFFLWELITQRRIKPELIAKINLGGYILLLGLILLVTWHDLFG